MSALIPRHIAIIMDGNGRWARTRSLPRIRGHAAGVIPLSLIRWQMTGLGDEIRDLTGA